MKTYFSGLNILACMLFSSFAHGQECSVSESFSGTEQAAAGIKHVSKDTVVNLMKSVINSFKLKTDGTDTLQVAVEIDDVLLSQFKDSATCYQYILQLYNKVDSIYFKEINIHVAVCHFDIVRNNPYSESTATVQTVCTNFENAWNANHSKIKRTTAQFLTYSFAGGGGYGLVGELGNQFAYSDAGVTAAKLNAYFPATRQYISSMTYDVYIVAHELSHNCGSHHTASCFYSGFALDTCGNPSDACLPNGKGAMYDYISGKDTFWYYYNPGSILSYCVNPGPIGPKLSFILPGDITLGIAPEQQLKVSFSVYPNPVSGYFGIYGVKGKFRISVQDITGRTVIQKTSDQIETEMIDVSALPAGIYIVNIYGDQESGSEKIVIR